MLMHGHQGALPRPEGDPRCYGRFWPADTATRGYPLTPSVPAYKVCQTVFGGRAPGSSAMHLRAGLDEPATREGRGVLEEQARWTACGGAGWSVR